MMSLHQIRAREEGERRYGGSNPEGLRWKGHQPTVTTVANANHRFALDAKRWLAQPVGGRDPEEEIRLRVESQRLDAMYYWVYFGWIIDRRWFIKDKAVSKPDKRYTEEAA